MTKQFGINPRTGLIDLISDDGQPGKHWLLQNFETRQARVSEERKAIAAKKNDPVNRQNYSVEGLRNLVARHEANITQILREGEAADLQRARDEWAAIQTKRDELLTQRRKQLMSDISPVEYESAKDKLRRLVENSQNVLDIARKLEGLSDPAQRIAAHNILDSLTKKRFPNDPANGSLAAWLERDSDGYFETDASRGQLEKARELKTAAGEVGALAHRTHNDGFIGQGYDAAFAAGFGKFHTQIQGLSGEIAHYLGEDALSQAEAHFVTLGATSEGYFGDSVKSPAPAMSEG